MLRQETNIIYKNEVQDDYFESSSTDNDSNRGSEDIYIYGIEPDYGIEGRESIASIKSQSPVNIFNREIAHKRKRRDDFILHYLPWVDSDQPSVETIVSLEDEEEETSSDESSYLSEVEEGDSERRTSDLYELFPVPEVGINPYSIPRVDYDADGIRKFVDSTKSMGVRSISSLKEQLLTDTIDLRHYGVDSRIMKALGYALEDNITVENIYLEGNELSESACIHLNELLRNNFNLKSLDLSNCRIGPRGMQQLESGFQRTSLLDLKLRGCAIGSEGLHHLSNAVQLNMSLQSLDLSNNSLDKSCGQDLKLMLSNNRYLEKLDLSWNLLADAETCSSLFAGLEKGGNIRDLNLSWNALGSECVASLCTYLTNSKTLERLVLKDNKLTDIEAEKIAKAFRYASNLRELFLGNNPLTSKGAIALAQAVNSANCPKEFTVLELENVCVNKEICQLVMCEQNLDKARRAGINTDEIKKFIKGVHILLEHFKPREPDAKKIFLKRAIFEAMSPKNKKKRKNFGHFVLSLPNDKIDEARFEGLVKKFKLPLSKSLINEIFKAFADGEFIDLANLKEFYLREYPDTELPLAITKTKRKKKKEKTKKKSKKSKGKKKKAKRKEISFKDPKEEMNLMPIFNELNNWLEFDYLLREGESHTPFSMSNFSYDL